MSTATQPTITEEPAEVYHADDSHESATRIKLLDESPATYKARFIDKTLPFVDTEDLRFGRIFHVYMLEPENFEIQCPMMPAFEHDSENMTKEKKPKRTHSKNTEYYQTKAAEFLAANKGKDFVTAEDLEKLKAMRAAVMDHDDARYLMEADGLCEHVIRWEDRIFRRARFDKILPDDGVIADFKTMADDVSPFAFGKACADRGWHLQAAWYKAAAETLYGREFRVVFICCSKKPPYVVATHQVSDEPRDDGEPTDMEWAEQRIEELVTELIERRQTGNWKASYQLATNDVPLPRYVRNNFWEVE